ncbi:MAG: HTH-type transcriptional activator IlvY [Spirochaetales bacterium]|uniref:HTH-type transcriptional activator IlvY n=1 Tax=Candidatus Thalassospirochaeta sargassi TaxID=3119039 RepID=A0AAJ1IG79_9SPIO|nr:HTH-type transcriptional activator IlvY [Spirochaetales bacterium]
MDNYSLRLFLTLAENLHFGRTSQLCNISRSALSRQIQRLEDEVGQKLFERDNRMVSLTPAGVRFSEYASKAVDLWKEMNEELLEEKTVLKGELSVYCSVTACYSVLPDILVKFRKKYPDIHIKLKTGDASAAISNIQEGRADIAIAARPDRLASSISFREIAVTPLVFILPSVDWAYSDCQPEQLPWDSIPMILPERELARRRVDVWFRKKGIRPNVYAQVSGNEAILAMVNLGFGVGVIPQLVFEKRPFEVDVRPIKVEPPLQPYSVGLCAQQRRLGSPLIKAFWQIVRQAD